MKSSGIAMISLILLTQLVLTPNITWSASECYIDSDPSWRKTVEQSGANLMRMPDFDTIREEQDIEKIILSQLRHKYVDKYNALTHLNKLSVQQFYLLLVSQNPHTVDYVNSKGKSKTIDIKKKSMYLATRWVGFLESIECRTGSSSGILTNLSESLNTFSKRGVFFDKVIKNAIVGYSPIAATSDLLKKKLLEEYYRQRQMQEVELGKLEKRGEELGKRGEELRKRGEELKKNMLHSVRCFRQSKLNFMTMINKMSSKNVKANKENKHGPELPPIMHTPPSNDMEVSNGTKKALQQLR